MKRSEGFLLEEALLAFLIALFAVSYTYALLQEYHRVQTLSLKAGYEEELDCEIWCREECLYGE